jgi:hypothetical protein
VRQVWYVLECTRQREGYGVKIKNRCLKYEQPAGSVVGIMETAGEGKVMVNPSGCFF